ncbi:putative transcription factor C2H2 family [Helianthus anomalus]
MSSRSKLLTAVLAADLIGACTYILGLEGAPCRSGKSRRLTRCRTKQDIQRETCTCILFDRHSHSFSVFVPSNKLDLAQSKFVLSLVALHKSKQLNVHLGGPTFAPDFIKEVVKKFRPGLGGLKERFPGLDFVLNTRHDTIYVLIVRSTSSTPGQTPYCSICLCEVEDGYRLEKCNHEFCSSCLVDQCESSIKNPGNNFPMRCAHEVCGELILVVDFKSLLSTHKVDELFRASLGSFVAYSSGKYRFFPSPECPSVYQVAGDGDPMRPFACGACSAATCT